MMLLPKPRHGIAMLMVLSVVGLVVALGTAMLASASLQACAARNAATSAQADALTDSGIELACLYLMRPCKAPPFVGTYWPGQQGISFGSATPGTVDVTVSSLGADGSNHEMYSIAATGHSGGIDRSSSCTVSVAPGFRAKYAVAFDDASVTIPFGSTINDSLQASDSVTNLGTVNGNVYAKTWQNQGALSGTFTPLVVNEQTIVPPPLNVRDYTTYTWQGKAYLAKKIFPTQNPGAALRPTDDNPAGVFYCDQSLTLNKDTVVEGTLVVRGSLTVLNSNNSIKPAPGFPAAVISGDVDLRHAKFTTPEFSAEGLVWMHGKINSSVQSGDQAGAAGKFTVNGSLLMSAGSIQSSGFLGKVIVSHNAANVDNVQLDAKAEPPSVMLVSFK